MDQAQPLCEGDLVTAHVFRFDPTRDQEPYYETFQVPYTKAMRVLDALEAIVEDQGHDIAYRWFCGVKKCGSCALTVNGRPCLACWEPAEREMTIEPIAGYPVLRDLVVDRTQFDKDVLKLRPWLKRNNPYTGFPEPLKPEEMEHAVRMLDCIECLLCVSACPSFVPDGDFVGPAPLVQMAKFALDVRDSDDRSHLAQSEGRIDLCDSCAYCTEACPSNIPVKEWVIDGLRARMRAEGFTAPDKTLDPEAQAQCAGHKDLAYRLLKSYRRQQ